jgi:hypothetical protein
MNDLKEKAKAISDKYPFGPFNFAATATSVIKEEDGAPGSCANHLDADFMALLRSGAHLDTDLLPLK